MKQNKKGKFHISFSGMLCGVVVIGLAIGLVINYLSLNEVSAELTAAKNTYETLSGQEKSLNYEIEKQVNFTNIDQLAARVGMVKLQPSQIQYIDIVQVDNMSARKELKDDTLVKNIVASFNILVEYLK